MDDQKVIRFSEALRNVSGVFQSNDQGGQTGEFTIRGFASELNVFKNGFRDDTAQYTDAAKTRHQSRTYRSRQGPSVVSVWPR